MLTSKSIQFFTTTRNKKTSILDGYKFPSEIKNQILKNVEYLEKKSYLFNRVPDSNLYVLDIINFFNNNNIEEYIKNNNDILGLSFPRIATILNEFVFGINYSDYTVNRYNREIVDNLNPVLKEKLYKFMDLYIPDPLSEKQFLPGNNFSNAKMFVMIFL